MADFTPNIRIYKINDTTKSSGNEEEIIITDHTHNILYDHEGVHVKPVQALLDVTGSLSENYAVYQLGTHVYRWNIGPVLNSRGEKVKSEVQLTQMLPKQGPVIEKGFPSIVSVAVVARTKYDEVSKLYLDQMTNYQQRVGDARNEQDLKIQTVREKAAREIRELEREREAAVAKITRPILDLESLLK